MPEKDATPAADAPQSTDATADGTTKTEETVVKPEETPKENDEVAPPAEEVHPSPKQMWTVVLTGYGAMRMVKLQQRPEPTPGKAEVLIRVKACGVGFQDLMLRQGAIDNPPKTPLIMGYECAGVVEAVGDDVADFKVGDRVMALTEGKAWAELVTAQTTLVYKMPDGLSFEDGAALLLQYITAYILLFHLANIHKGQSLLLHSAGGGVGQALIQLCHTVGDITVFATASPHKHEKLKEQVHHLFAHNQDYVNAIRKVSPEGVDVVLDCLSGEHSNRGINLLKPMGRYFLYGSNSMVTGETKSFFSSAKSWWQVDKVSPFKLYEDNHIIGGFHLRRLLFRHRQHDFVRGVVENLLELYGQGKIKPVIDSVLALEDVADGLQTLRDRKNFGKILLDPSKEPKPHPRKSKLISQQPKEPPVPEPAGNDAGDGEGEKSETTSKSEPEKAEAAKEPEKSETTEKVEPEKAETTPKPDASGQ